MFSHWYLQMIFNMLRWNHSHVTWIKLEIYCAIFKHCQCGTHRSLSGCCTVLLVPVVVRRASDVNVVRL